MWTKKTHKGSRVSRLRLGLCASALGLVACVDPDSPLVEDSAEGCDEFVVGQDVDSNLEVDQTVKHFMQAASDFAQVGNDMEAAVLTACSNIARDLGATDSWSAIEVEKDRISNASGTGACDVAGQKAEQLLIAAGPVEGTFAIAVSRGECHLDFEAQAKCDADCAANAVCDPGTVETRCEPGSLNVQCQASCQAGATCVGKPELPANCMGSCESTCTGACKGICIHKDGKKTENDPNCMGKCASQCNGTCAGRCKIDAPEGLSCGANVSCTGGCTGTYTDPVCVTEFKPPTCTVNAECHAACSAEVVANAECDPPIVDVFVDVTTHPELQPLVDTLRINLPALISAAETQGKLAVDAAHRLGDSGEVIATKIENLDGKSLACLGKASTAVGNAVGKLDVSVQASANVTVKVNHETL
jgi:hypothetical protein